MKKENQVNPLVSCTSGSRQNVSIFHFPHTNCYQHYAMSRASRALQAQGVKATRGNCMKYL